MAQLLFVFFRCGEDAVSVHEDHTDCSSVRYARLGLILICERQKCLGSGSLNSVFIEFQRLFLVSHLFYYIFSFLRRLFPLLDIPINTTGGALKMENDQLMFVELNID